MPTMTVRGGELGRGGGESAIAPPEHISTYLSSKTPLNTFWDIPTLPFHNVGKLGLFHNSHCTYLMQKYLEMANCRHPSAKTTIADV